MISNRMRSLAAAVLVAAPVSVSVPASAQDALVITGARIERIAGAPIGSGTVVVAGGKIRGVGPSVAAPNGARVIDAKGCVVTPGFIDADAGIGLTRENEEIAEVMPEARVSDGIDTRDRGFRRRLRAGFTAAFVGPGSRAVIGGHGVVLKTTGRDLARVLVRDGTGLRVAMGGEPSSGNRSAKGSPSPSIYQRRPTTRMGIVFLLREALYDYRAWKAGRPPRGANVARLAALDPAGSGAIPMRVHARTAVDLTAMLNVAAELDLPMRIVFDEATEAHAVVDMLARRKASVVLGPFYFYPRDRREMAEGANVALDNAACCHRAGIPLAFRTGGAMEPRDLRASIGLLVGYGLPASAALEALTLGAARMTGVADRLGSIEVGKDADLVIWEGDPLSPTTRVRAVIVDGQVEYHRPPASAAAAQRQEGNG